MQPISDDSNYAKFLAALEAAYVDLFANDPEYAYAAACTTPAALAGKMTAGLLHGGANKGGAGIKRACKACGIKVTYAAIQAFLKN